MRRVVQGVFLVLATMVAYIVPMTAAHAEADPSVTPLPATTTTPVPSWMFAILLLVVLLVAATIITLVLRRARRVEQQQRRPVAPVEFSDN